MLDATASVLAGFDLEQMNLVVLLGVGLGSMVGVVGLYGALAAPDPSLRRYRSGSVSGRGRAGGPALVKEQDRNPSGVMKAVMPTDLSERSRVQRQLLHAGIKGKNAVAKFYLVRALLGIVLPSVLLLIAVVGSPETLPGPLAWVTSLSPMEMLQYLGILVGVGFYGPAYWLKAKASARRRAITEAFPNALDLMQISAEAGLGFDAAMTRVAAEMQTVSPDISEEFITTQREILAGRDRSKALTDMAERMDVDEARSFANVIMQSMRFGTSVSDALLTYADEMRRTRELKAQEKANKLPVQMSGVMAALMMPALLLITLTPVVIRFVNFLALAGS